MVALHKCQIAIFFDKHPSQPRLKVASELFPEGFGHCPTDGKITAGPGHCHDQAAPMGLSQATLI